MRGDYGKMMADGNPDPKVATPCFLAAVLAHHFPSTPAPSEEEKKKQPVWQRPLHPAYQDPHLQSCKGLADQKSLHSCAE